MEAAHPHHNLFLSPSQHHLAELRMEPAHSAVAFSAPGAAAGRKRRCLLPAVSPRKKMLLELHPFDSAPSPPPSPRRSPATAPPLLSRVASPASDFSFQPALAWSGGCGGGNIFAFWKNAPATPSPAGSNASGVTFLASPGQPSTPKPKGSTSGGVFAFMTSTKQPGTPTGPTANGGFFFMTSPGQPSTPTGSTAAAAAGLSPLSTEPSLSPRDYHGGRTEGATSTPSPKHARTGSTDSGGLAFFPSPGPAIGHTGSPAPPVFVFSASKTSPPPARKSGGASNKRSQRHLAVATERRKSLRRWEGPQQVTAPPHKVAKSGGEASRSSIQSGSAARPCCTFFTSPLKASKQEAKKASRSSSPAGSRCTFATSPARPSPVGKESKQEGEGEVSSVARESTTPTSPAACRGAAMVVQVTCTCGVNKEFSFDHCH